MVAVQAPPAQDPLDSLDRKRLPELQYLSTFCPFSLNSKPCPHGSKCTLKRLCHVLCKFRCNTGDCDGHHDVAPMCDQFLTDKGCKHRKEDDHPWFARSHDFELRRCMDVMIKPHTLGLYGVQHS
ncbi:hypothetical protein E4T52_06747 [Aureobasidium sp. EXF-3400]|nr:hypothetical protein E4T51_06657 [Aureobasidium sp. EXF-12344]KAI4778307.1 hypothetical protein E4T52_06747 [Aureobasidium sp. EXF-3400]